MFATSLFTKLALAGSTALAVAMTALPAAASVNGDIYADQRYINRETYEGRLNPWQRDRLEYRLRSIEAQRNYDLARNGGYLTPYERYHLEAEANYDRAATYYDSHRPFRNW